MTKKSGSWIKITPLSYNTSFLKKIIIARLSVLPFPHLHAIRRASLHLLWTHFFPIRGEHCPIWLNLWNIKPHITTKEQKAL